jgi:hypothetical protein
MNTPPDIAVRPTAPAAGIERTLLPATCNSVIAAAAVPGDMPSPADVCGAPAAAPAAQAAGTRTPRSHYRALRRLQLP